MAPKKTLGHVAVIGGCGFTGFNTVNLILERYPESKIAVLDVRTTVNRLDDHRVSYYDSDITHLASLSDLFKKLKLDVVIHHAALTVGPHVPKSVVYKVNVDGTKNLLAAAQESGVKAFVYTSSSSVVIGNVWEVVNADESWPVLVGKDQPEYYSETKALAEIATLEANRASPSFLTCAIRPAGIIGEYDTLMLYRICLIKGSKTYIQIGDNNNLFDTTHVKNVSYAHLLAAEALLQTLALGVMPLDTERVDGEAFFVTNGEPVYFWDFTRQVWKARGFPADKKYDIGKVFVLGTGVAMVLATILELIMGIFGKTPNFQRVAVRNSAMTRYFCIDKARMRLKYEPLIPLEAGIERGVAEVRTRL